MTRAPFASAISRVRSWLSESNTTMSSDQIQESMHSARFASSFKVRIRIDSEDICARPKNGNGQLGDQGKRFGNRSGLALSPVTLGSGERWTAGASSPPNAIAYAKT